MTLVVFLSLHFLRGEESPTSSVTFPPLFCFERGFPCLSFFSSGESKVSASVYYLNGRLGDREKGRGKEIRPFEIGEWVRRVENFRETAAGAASFFGKKGVFACGLLLDWEIRRILAKGKKFVRCFPSPLFGAANSTRGTFLVWPPQPWKRGKTTTAGNMRESMYSRADVSEWISREDIWLASKDAAPRRWHWAY